MLQNKKILLGVCGSIAAYKIAILVRLLVKAGAEVKVILTTSASAFITPLTLSTLSKNPVLQSFIKGENGEWNNHVALGLWADVLLVAPASAHTIAKFANGLCDNLLCATYLSARCPVYIAAAMDLDMYQHPTTSRNLQILRENGNKIIDAVEGELASGLHGVGRMAEPEDLFKSVEAHFQSTMALKGKNVLVTAGPTYEAIDPVRFIGNYSSGKMGYAIAHKAAAAGAKVTLISGPCHLKVYHPEIKLEKVTSAEEMFSSTITHHAESDIVVFAAAVADYTIKESAGHKIKSKAKTLSLALEKTKDIASEIGKLKKKNQLLIGFALETENEVVNAREKLTKKNLDLIVLNSLNDKGAGFSHDTNKITIIDKDNNQDIFELKNKDDVATDIINAIIKKLDV